MRYLPVLAVTLTVVLAGCTQSDNRLGADTEQNRLGTAMVREMSSSEMPMAMDQCDQMMMRHMGEADENYDQRFINMMSRHHEGAIHMAQDAVKNAKHPEIKQFAQKIINDQQKEIKQLQAWEQQWYGNRQSATNP
jgi:uncharacterized protein (DUF305 family)